MKEKQKNSLVVRQVQPIVGYKLYDTEIIPAEMPFNEIIFFQRAFGQSMAWATDIKNQCYTNAPLAGQLAAPCSFKKVKAANVIVSLDKIELVRFLQDGCFEIRYCDGYTFTSPLEALKIALPDRSINAMESFQVILRWARNKMVNSNVRIRVELVGNMYGLGVYK